MTIDRFVALRFPLTSQSWRKPKFAFKMSSIVIGTSLVYTSPIIYTAQVIGEDSCVGKTFIMIFLTDTGRLVFCFFISFRINIVNSIK